MKRKVEILSSETPQFWKELIEGNYSVEALTAGKTSAMEAITAIAFAKRG